MKQAASIVLGVPRNGVLPSLVQDRPVGALVRSLLPTVLLLVCCVFTVVLRIGLNQLQYGRATTIEQLEALPRGEVLKPVLLGFNQIGADLLWLRIVQVMGSEALGSAEYTWLYHALDVATTVDPQFVIAYDLGGGLLAELAGRVDWSNALLAKGFAANPDSWRLPFLLGFNHFFHLHDYARAAEYMAQAARLLGAPAYVPELAARLYVQAHDVNAALACVDAILDQTIHPSVRESLERRKNELIVERDVDQLEHARQAYVRSRGRSSATLGDFVTAGFLPTIPVEPFGGTYLLDPETDRIISTTHPTRMRLYRPSDASLLASHEAKP